MASRNKINKSVVKAHAFLFLTSDLLI